MLQELIEQDPIIRFLVSRSKITAPQLDSCVIDAISHRDDQDLEEKVSMRDGKRVTKGSFLRTLKQGKENVEKSIYMLILSEYLDILPQDIIEDVVKVGKMLKDLKMQDVDPEKVKEILLLLHKFSDVMSQR